VNFDGCSCSCTYDFDPAAMYNARMVTARKPHGCCECGEPIVKGEVYHRADGMWDGRWDHWATCRPCALIRDDICCGWFVFGELREAVWSALDFDYLDDEGGEE